MRKVFNHKILIVLFILTSTTRSQWFAQYGSSQDYNLRDVFALDQSSAFVVGFNQTLSRGIILKTSNGGENWLTKSDSSTENRYYTSVQFINNSTGWIAGGGSLAYGGASRILKSTDGGENWVEDSIGTGGLTAVYFIDANNGWAVGITGWDVPPSGCGMMFKSTNGGINWSPQYGAFDPLWFVFFINQNIGWVGGSPGCGWYNDSTIYKTTNNGITWNVQFNGNNSFESSYFVNENTGWITGYSWNGSSTWPIILKTTDGGATWVSQSVGLNNALLDLYFIDANTGWVVGSGGVILKSTDGGNSWFSQESGTTNNLHSVCFADENIGWIVGDNGTILKTTNGGVTFLEEENNLPQPEGFVLEQNYPNPFNPSTTIRYSVPASDLITLKVYDVLGKEIETLVKREIPAGSYEYNFNGIDLPSGVYFYQLKAGSFVETKKMILLK